MADGIETLALVAGVGLLGYAAYRFMGESSPLPVSTPPAQPQAPASPTQPESGSGIFSPTPPYYQQPYGPNYEYPPMSQTPPTIRYTDPVQALARTIYGEARGEASAGRSGVANTVVNRVNDAAGRWPRNIAGVCQAVHANGFHDFSCWNPNDPNYHVITTVTNTNPVFRACVAIAQRAVARTLPDNTKGANFYHDVSMGHIVPHGWPADTVFTIQIGRLLFYRSPGTGTTVA